MNEDVTAVFARAIDGNSCAVNLLKVFSEFAEPERLLVEDTVTIGGVGSLQTLFEAGTKFWLWGIYGKEL